MLHKHSQAQNIIFQVYTHISGSRGNFFISYYSIDYEEITKISGICRVPEMDFHCFARPRNGNADLKYDVPCLCVCSVYLLQLGVVAA